MTKQQIARIEEDWKSIVYDKVDEVDPDNEEDWSSLALGFCLGRGFSVKESLQLVEIFLKHNVL
jgi:hypothetical protein